MYNRVNLGEVFPTKIFSFASEQAVCKQVFNIDLPETATKRNWVGHAG